METKSYDLTGLSIHVKRRVLRNLKRNKFKGVPGSPTKAKRVYGAEKPRDNNTNNTKKQTKVPSKFKGYNCKQYLATLEKFNEYGQVRNDSQYGVHF